MTRRPPARDRHGLAIPRAAACVVAAIIASTATEAKACYGSVRAPVMYPRSGDIAAINTHVWVFAQDGWRSPRGARVDAGQVRVALVADRPVAATRRDLHDGNVGVIELIPDGELAPGVEYAIELWAGGERVASQRFRAGERTDDAPPEWPGVTRVAVGRTPASRVDCNRCPDRAHPWIELTLEDAQDDTTPRSEILYAVWLPDRRGVVDGRQPPTTYLEGPSSGRPLILGEDDWCGAATSPTELNAFRGSFRGIVRAVDLAGHRTPAALIETNLR